MRNTFIFIIVLFVVSAAIWGIFNLIFPTTSTLMVFSTLSGILMAVALAYNLLLVSKHSRLTVKNASTTWCVNVCSVVLFLWTMCFTFVLGSYLAEDRSLTTLYVGYLIIIIAGIVLWVMADQGGSLAETQNAEVQSVIVDRNCMLSNLSQIKLSLESLDSDTRSELHKSMDQNIALLRKHPHP